MKHKNRSATAICELDLPIKSHKNAKLYVRIKKWADGNKNHEGKQGNANCAADYLR